MIVCRFLTFQQVHSAHDAPDPVCFDQIMLTMAAEEFLEQPPF